jgi:flagellar motility protein MotE (MotC chaperone)
VIAELRQQVSNLQRITSDKSPFMDFEEIMPASELSDYIQLQKEIKRLQEDNRHLADENARLLSERQDQVNSMRTINLDREIDESPQKERLDKLENEVRTLQNRLKLNKDKHEDEIIALQNNYRDKLNQIYETHNAEIVKLRDEKDELLGWKAQEWNNIGKFGKF